MTAVDLFSGPRGWDVGARMAGLPDALGIELDEAACATSEAAGFPTLRADVSELDPLDFAPCELLIASAPCPTFSNAGRRGAAHLTAVITRCMADLIAGRDTRAECREEAYALLGPIYWREEQAKAKKKGRKPDREKSAATARRDALMSMLVVEPLRWTLALRPARVALEQVDTVQPLWNHLATLLRAEGYRVWTGILSAERFGVPQTRRRAILMASLDGPVHPPAPTHQAYVPGEPAREEHTLEGTLLPWISMAEALGWRGVERPAPTVTAGGGDAGGVEVFASRASRAGIAAMRANAQANAAVRDADEPAPTITGGHDTGERVWLPSHMAKKEDRPERKAQGAGNQPRAVETPAATLDTRTDLATWVGERPAPHSRRRS